MPINAVKNHYLALADMQKEIVKNCLDNSDYLAILTKSHNVISDMSKISELMNGLSEQECVKLAISEAQYALYAATSGDYRHAFGGLRLAFEFLLSAIYFSGHEIYFWHWKRGFRDIGFKGLVDNDKGIFSQLFLSSFSEEMREAAKQYKVLTETTYRECSEYVHGNPNTHYLNASDLEFNDLCFRQWHQHLDTIYLSFLFCFFARYELSLGSKIKVDLEDQLLANLGHHKYIQDFFGEIAA